MSIDEFIIAVFCFIDDEMEKFLKGKKLRARGKKPALEDSEVLTMEVVGEFLGHDGDKAIWEYFKRHWLRFFPKIPCRTSFIRQAANLHIVKNLLQEQIAARLGALIDSLHIVDGLPMPVCKFARAHFSQIFKGEATYGYCATKKEHFYGFKGHIMISSIGIVTQATFAPANVDERDVCPELSERIQGLLLGDKGYIRPELKDELKKKGVNLQTPLRDNMKDDRPKAFLKRMLGIRRLVETIIGQLTERFHIEKIRAKDLWHQYSRFWRKILAHTVCIALCIENSQKPLQFERLVH
ncbi:MAG: IS982 family transposase [Simkania sp.]|nr:IS982 family transposase [Simkania sp.]